ncbi:MAG: hypothetical protein K0Q92_653 [Steroidobacteraceae bacterium]|jgi:hypothetical protein|nr:hypothetical protein [Steroidobacteraceae bacterium]
MNTPKELADKAKQQAREYAHGFGYQSKLELLDTTIDQLQAMAEARQGSGEHGLKVDDMARVLQAAWAKAEPDHGVTLNPASYWSTFADMARAALNAAPPSAQQATGSGLVLTDEQRRACVEAYHQHGLNPDELMGAMLTAATQAQTFAGFKVVVDPSLPADAMKLVAAPTTGNREPLPSAETLLTWAVEDGVIRLSQMMNADLQDALVNFAARITGEQR